MSTRDNYYSEISLPDSNSLEEFAEYGFISYDAPKKVRHAGISEKAYNDIERIRKGLDETQGHFCGRILTEAIRKNYKPLNGAVQKNCRLKMETDKSVVAYLNEADNSKLDTLAKNQGLKTGDYIRLVLYAALKGWNNSEVSA